MYNNIKKKDIKSFDEWYGGWGCEGHPPVGYATRKEAEHTQKNVISEMRGVRGLIQIKVDIVDRYGDGKYWVRNTTTYDKNAQY